MVYICFSLSNEIIMQDRQYLLPHKIKCDIFVNKQNNPTLTGKVIHTLMFMLT